MICVSTFISPFGLVEYLDSFLVLLYPIYDSLSFLLSMPRCRLYSTHNPSIAPASSQAPEPSVSMYSPSHLVPNVYFVYSRVQDRGISRGISCKYNVEEQRSILKMTGRSKTNMISTLERRSLQQVIPKGLLRFIFLFFVAFQSRGPFHPNLISLFAPPVVCTILNYSAVPGHVAEIGCLQAQWSVPFLVRYYLRGSAGLAPHLLAESLTLVTGPQWPNQPLCPTPHPRPNDSRWYSASLYLNPNRAG